jgi:hypothetical protein
MCMYPGKFFVNNIPYILVGCSTCINGNMRFMTQESVIYWLGDKLMSNGIDTRNLVRGVRTSPYLLCVRAFLCVYVCVCGGGGLRGRVQSLFNFLIFSKFIMQYYLMPQSPCSVAHFICGWCRF